MRTCEEFEDLISAFIDGALTGEDRAELMEHMAVCPVCQAYFDQQIALHDALMADAEAIQVPEGFTEDVMARVRFTPQEKRKRTAVRWQRWAALAACCAIAAAGLWQGTLRQKPADVSRAADGAAPREEFSMDTTRAASEPDQADDFYREAAEREPEEKDGGGSTFTAGQTSPTLNSAPPPANTAGSGSVEPDAGAGMESSVEPQALEDDSGAAVESGEPAAGQESYTEPAQSGALPEPAAPAPAASEKDALLDEGKSEARPRVLTTTSPAAAAWVEETLGLPWTEGGRYELSAGEYEQLREVLSSAGESFWEQPDQDGADGFLLIAENSPETE